MLLTVLLICAQESLGGNAKTMLICNISPAVAFAEETQITLEFARGAKELKNRVGTVGCLLWGMRIFATARAWLQAMLEPLLPQAAYCVSFICLHRSQASPGSHKKTSSVHIRHTFLHLR